jgi:hypothetical protein
MRRLFDCGLLVDYGFLAGCGRLMLLSALCLATLSQTGFCQPAPAQFSQERFPPAPQRPPLVGEGVFPARSNPPANNTPPAHNKPQQPDNSQKPDWGQKPDRNHGDHDHRDRGHWHHGHWYSGGSSWLWPVPVVFPYYTTPAFYGYHPNFANSYNNSYNGAAYNTAPVTAINTAPVISPAPAAAPGDAIKSTNADQKALAGRFIGFGDVSFAKQKYLAALGRYKTAIETAPDVAEAYFRQGLAHVALGQYASAAKAFRRGLVVRSSWHGSPFRLDTLYGAAGQQIKIQHLEALAQSVESNPFDAELLLVLGVSLYFDGQIDRAELCFGRVTQLGGDSRQLLRDFLPPPGPAGVAPPAKPSGRVSF